MFEDDTSECHSMTVSCGPRYLQLSPAASLSAHPLTVFVVKRPMKSLQNDDCDRKRRSHAG